MRVACGFLLLGCWSGGSCAEGLGWKGSAKRSWGDLCCWKSLGDSRFPLRRGTGKAMAAGGEVRVAGSSPACAGPAVASWEGELAPLHQGCAPKRGAKGQGEGCHQANGRAQGSCRMEPGANPPQLAAQTPLIKGEGRLALLVAAPHAGRAVVGWHGAPRLLQPLQAGGPHPLLPRPAPSPRRLHCFAVACVCGGEVQLCL